MEVELREIRDFISDVPPFDLLTEEDLNQLLRHISIRYFRRGKSLPQE